MSLILTITLNNLSSTHIAGYENKHVDELMRLARMMNNDQNFKNFITKFNLMIIINRIIADESD